jgi:ferredoxin-type protein NapH
MNLRKGFKFTGIFLIIVSILVSFLLLTWSEFVLTEDIINREGEGKKFEILKKEAGSMFGQRYDLNINFILDLGKVFKRTNQRIRDLYGIQDLIIEKLLDLAGKNEKYVFSTSIIDQAFPQKNEINEIKIRYLQDYSGWMNGREYDTKEALRKQLENVRKTINNNLIYQEGFGNYQIGQVKFNLTKHASRGMLVQHPLLWFFLTVGLMCLGGLVYAFAVYGGRPPGIKNNGIYFSSLKSLGWLGIVLGIVLTGFYVIIYFYPEYITNWVILVDPLSRLLNGGEASHWFLYGVLYTLAILVMGVRMFLKYRGNNIQLLRTGSVMFFQLGFAFLIPEILYSLSKPGFDFKNIWPLDYDFFYNYNLEEMMASGAFGWFILFWGIMLIVIAVPLLSFFLGKRWYCSWVCGCGALAETMGDPFRHLSDKSLKAWKIERWLVHGILAFAVLNTGAVLYTYITGQGSIAGIGTEQIKSVYGFLIGSVFAGVIGVGAYPLMGSRVWCRFGCPLAAYLGLVQRFKSRFRITTNGGQCISCGNCSTFCEMGIDVRWYAQRGQNIIRASCVGCGICAAVCPRGVLKLENKKEGGRFNGPALAGNENYHPVSST